MDIHWIVMNCRQKAWKAMTPGILNSQEIKSYFYTILIFNIGSFYPLLNILYLVESSKSHYPVDSAIRPIPGVLVQSYHLIFFLNFQVAFLIVACDGKSIEKRDDNSKYIS